MREYRMTALVIIRDGKVTEFQTVKDWTECTVFTEEGNGPISVCHAADILREELEAVAIRSHYEGRGES